MVFTIFLSFVCLLFIGTNAVKNHGMAHKETEKHAINSQKIATDMHHLHQKGYKDVISQLQSLKKGKKDQIKDLVNDPVMLKKLRKDLVTAYNPSPAISLLQKTSFSKPFVPEKPAVNKEKEEEKVVMNELFGFDENKLKEFSEELKKTDPDFLSYTNKQKKSEPPISFEDGFSEEKIKKILEKQSIQNSQLIQLSEGSSLSEKSKVIDWNKWNKFLMNEFEGSRLDGSLDSAAHQSQEFVDFRGKNSENSISTNIELGEGIEESVNGIPTDKLCGCEISLTPVCGSDGETYPSNCFAKCAGLSISHEGPCLSKNELNKNNNFLSLKINPNTNKLEVKTEEQTLLTLDDANSNDVLAQTFAIGGENQQADILNQRPGVDYPAFSTNDAIQSAKQSVEESLKPRVIELPFKEVKTKRQFEENLKKLTEIADQFESVASDEKMAKCQCRGEFSPVCGTDFKTYPSTCYASCLGVTLRHVGQCHDNIKMEINKSNSFDDFRDPICFCSLRQKTVCGVNGVTYLNRCFAECEKITVRDDGPCLPSQQ